ncbi:hypothetical protein [Desulfatitalea tepidiphila]|uniref:hypothetical protein n=1 Tax=Desulfatitalea tepidiphila TaxID=1185843 RepID=UPI00137923A1|nr:hypothetical protein [Desulfatitalea tepidiphila]
MGDCNDGPGQDHFETRYLFFDLIGNLQGEVLMGPRIDVIFYCSAPSTTQSPFI